MNLKIYKKTDYPNIYKHIKNGTYAVDLNLGYDIYGKRIRTTKTGILTEKEAKKILKDENIAKQTKNAIIHEYKFEELLEEYYDYCLNFVKLKAETIRKKKSRFNVRILPFFKNATITKIDGSAIANFHKYLNNTKLNESSKNTIHKQLSAYFNWLIKYKKVISINPCQEVKNFKIPKKDIIYYTIEEINKLFDVIETDSINDKTKILYISILKLFFFSGLRVGELLGLKFKDFDFDLLNKNKIDQESIEINMHQTLYYGKGGWIETDGKTDKSLDNLFVGKKVIEPLFDYIKLMQNFGIKYDQNDYIYTNFKTSKVYSIESIRKEINKYMIKANLKHISLKDLRHSHATFLLSNGYSLEEVKNRLRHTNQKTTEQFYATFYEKSKKKLAADLDKFA